jgi:DNA-binding NtrC family response regulator
VDKLGVYSDDTIEVVLPEAGPAHALDLARRLVDDDGAQLVCGVATFPDSATSAEELLTVAREAVQRATRAEPVRAAASQASQTWTAPGAGTGPPIAESAGMRELYQTAQRVARGAIPVLIQGETGTGKEVLARHIHESGVRRDRPIVCVNCAALPASLIESTLFGHEKGAFTGACQQHKGVFESADGGTVFLDEIGELPAAAQAALLRVLETKRFTRVGSSKELSVDVRIIAATHRDLETMCEEGGFRQDLYYRLNTITLKIPALRERRADIAPLARHLLELANRANESAVSAIDPEALELLEGYAWPGNIRELKNALERAVVIAQASTLTVDDLPERVRAGAGRPPRRTAAQPTGAPLSTDQLEGDFRTRMERLESEVLVRALRDAGWNQTEASRQLSMPLRTLVYKIRMHGIRRPTSGTG